MHFYSLTLDSQCNVFFLLPSLLLHFSASVFDSFPPGSSCGLQFFCIDVCGVELHMGGKPPCLILTCANVILPTTLLPISFPTLIYIYSLFFLVFMFSCQFSFKLAASWKNCELKVNPRWRIPAVKHLLPPGPAVSIPQLSQVNNNGEWDVVSRRCNLQDLRSLAAEWAFTDATHRRAH